MRWITTTSAFASNSGCGTARVSLLPLPLPAERLCLRGDVVFVPRGIDEGVGSTGFQLGGFFLQSEIGAVRSEEEVDRQFLQDLECFHVVFGDARVLRVSDEKITGVHVRAA